MQQLPRLTHGEAVDLVSKVLRFGGEQPAAQDKGREAELNDLVDAVNCHARSLVLLAGEVVQSGVTLAREHVLTAMRELEKRHPGSRELSLMASVKLSLARMPAELREELGPVGVFRGGGQAAVIAIALEIDPARVLGIAQALVRG